MAEEQKQKLINRMDDWIELLARYFRVFTKLILSLLIFTMSIGLVFGIYRYVMHIWNSTPKWIKWFL